MSFGVNGAALKAEPLLVVGGTPVKSLGRALPYFDGLRLDAYPTATCALYAGQFQLRCT